MYGLRLLAEPRVQRISVTLVLAVVLLFRIGQFAVFTTQIQWGYDFSAYWQAGANLLAGEPIYAADQLSGPYAPQRQYLYLYPPPLAAAVTPLSALVPHDYRAANWAWALLGAAIVAAVVLAVGRREGLFESGRLGGLLAGRRRWLLIGAAFALPPVVGELVLGNVHLLLLGLLGLAWLAIRRGTARGEWVAGFAVGVAAVVKVFPGLLLLWFLATRRWAGAAWLVAGALVTCLVALPLTGIEPWRDYPTVLANLAAPSDTHDTLAPTVWLAPFLGFSLARVVVTALGAVSLWWAARRLDERTSFAVAVTASVLVAPALYHHYLALLVLPFVLGLARGVAPIALVAAYLLLWGGQQDALGELSWIVNRGLPTAGVLVLFGGLLLAARPPILPSFADP
jgi:alpha-1,2-mannosyltransferase